MFNGHCGRSGGAIEIEIFGEVVMEARELLASLGRMEWPELLGQMVHLGGQGQRERTNPLWELIMIQKLLMMFMLNLAKKR